MALTVTSAGSGTSTSSGASLSTGATITASVDDWLVALVAADNNGTSGAASLSSVTDSAGNTWIQRAKINFSPGSVAGDGATLGIYTAAITSALASGTVTANFSPNTTSKTIQVYLVQPDTGEAIQFVDADATGSTGNATTHSATTVSVASGDTIFGAAAIEVDTSGGTLTGDSDTTNGSWSSLIARSASTGTNSTAIRSASQYKTVSATGDQSWACTTSGARDGARSYLVIRSVASGITGTASITEADDTLSATGVLDLKGTLAVTEANDTLAATGALLIKGTLATTEASDTLSAASVLAIKAAASITEGGDTLASAGRLAVVGTLSVTEANDTLSAAGTSALTGSASITEQNDTLSATGALRIAGTLAATEASDTLAATGQLVTQPVIVNRRAGTEDRRQEIERQQQEQLRQIIDRSLRIVQGEIDPVTYEPIAPPDYSAVIGELMRQALALDQARAEAFVIEQERLQEEEAISILLLAA